MDKQESIENDNEHQELQLDEQSEGRSSNKSLTSHSQSNHLKAAPEKPDQNPEEE
jgi:hypothetical protein